MCLFLYTRSLIKNKEEFMEETIEIPSYKELLNSLDEEFRTEQVEKELKIAILNLR